MLAADRSDRQSRPIELGLPTLARTAEVGQRPPLQQARVHLATNGQHHHDVRHCFPPKIRCAFGDFQYLAAGHVHFGQLSEIVFVETFAHAIICTRHEALHRFARYGGCTCRHRGSRVGSVMAVILHLVVGRIPVKVHNRTDSGWRRKRFQA